MVERYKMLVFIAAIAKAIAKIQIQNLNFRHCRFPDIEGFLEFQNGKQEEGRWGWVPEVPGAGGCQRRQPGPGRTALKR